jgi:hypothetical protein
VATLAGARTVRLAAALAVSALPWALVARAGDWTILSKTRFGEKEGAQTVFLTSARMKTSGGGSGALVDFDSGAMTFLDDEKKTYFVTSVTELDAYAREREEQARKSGFNTESFGPLTRPEARKTGRMRRIAGHACDDWRIAMGEGIVFEVCAARDLPAPAGYFEARGATYAGMGPMGRHFASMFGAMKAARGYPLFLAMHVRLESMKQESLTEATEVKAGAIPASAFEIPAGYAKKPSPFATK